ncbi:MAG: tRNA pseudouridine(55) synthase TruB [Vulcanimicrobiota bacterium]
MKNKVDGSDQLFGFINLFKPSGITSFDCIRRMRKIIGIKKIGHLGTLDPLADGILPLAVGKATRLIPYIEKARKKYQSEFLLGTTTSTDDIEGEITGEKDCRKFEIQTLQEVLKKFTGKISQVPPAVSAVKINGQRAYKMAREGRKVEISPRRVEVFELELLRYEHPVFEILCSVSPGTYIRSIARDVGTILGCGAVVKTLRRLESGTFRIDSSVTFNDFESNADIHQFLISPEKILKGFPRIVLDKPGSSLVKNGRAVCRKNVVGFENSEHPSLKIAVFDYNEKLVAMAREEEGLFVPEKVFITTRGEGEII